MGNAAPSRRTSPAPPSHRTPPTRRAALSLLAAAPAAALLTGCNGASTSSGGRVTLRYFFWGDVIRAELLGKCIKIFESEHPKIRIKSGFVAFDAYFQKLATAAAGGNPPDVMHVDFNWVRTLTDHGVLADLEEFSGPGKEIQPDTIVLALRTAGVVEGKRFCLPLAQNSLAMAYDHELWEQAGARPPSWEMSWAEFQDEALKVEEFTRGKQAGVDNLARDGNGIELYQLQHGRQFWTPEGRIGITRDDYREYLHYLTDWRRHGGLAGPEVYLESLPADPIAARRTASTILWDNQLATRVTQRGGPLALATPPTHGDVSGLYPKPGILAGVAAESPYRSQGARFVNFLINDPRCAEIMGANIGMPPTTRQAPATGRLKGLDRETLRYERHVADRQIPTPNPPGDGGAPLYLYQQRLLERFNYGRVSIDDAVDQFFDQVSVVLA
ncbi:ABC transporter substrate-binding protein [Streptomyces pathocidini]|uniref:ABC transporter substrate-binding protein n=1 Tax=Streptomyces pathocidini TaxID=1650571 RepID=A0ABW7UL56_9ACTN